MPGTDGLGVLRWLKKEHPDVGVIMATALGGSDDVIEAMRLGASDYLIKPFRIDLVEQEIQRAMERQQLLVENRQYQAELEVKVAEQTVELQRLNAELERQVEELQARDRLVQFQLAYHSAGEAQQEILETVSEALKAERAALYQVPESENRLRLVGFTEGGRLEALGSAIEDFHQAPAWSTDAKGVATEALQHQRATVRGEWIGLALRHGKEVMGALVLQGAGSTEMGGSLAGLGDQAALVLWKVKLLERIAEGAVDIEGLLQLK